MFGLISKKYVLAMLNEQREAYQEIYDYQKSRLKNANPWPGPVLDAINEITDNIRSMKEVV